MTYEELLELANELRRLANNASGWLHAVEDAALKAEIREAIDDLDAMATKLRGQARKQAAMATQLVTVAHTLVANEPKFDSTVEYQVSDLRGKTKVFKDPAEAVAYATTLVWANEKTKTWALDQLLAGRQASWSYGFTEVSIRARRHVRP